MAKSNGGKPTISHRLANKKANLRNSDVNALEVGSHEHCASNILLSLNHLPNANPTW